MSVGVLSAENSTGSEHFIEIGRDRHLLVELWTLGKESITWLEVNMVKMYFAFLPLEV